LIAAMTLRALIDWLTYRIDLLRQREAHAATIAGVAAPTMVSQAPQYQTTPPPNSVRSHRP